LSSLVIETFSVFLGQFLQAESTFLGIPLFFAANLIDGKFQSIGRQGKTTSFFLGQLR